MADEDLEALRRQPQAESILLAIPGVRSVAFGGKVAGGQPTHQFAYIVYVDKKKPPNEVPAGQMIPREIEGVPTDVLEEGQPRQLSGIIQGGIRIVARYTTGGVTNSTAGTLGCIGRSLSAQQNNGPPDVMLSCYHVLYSDGFGQAGDEVIEEGCCTNTTLGFVGTESKYDGLVDAALAHFKSGVDVHAQVHGDAVTATLDLRPGNPDPNAPKRGIDLLPPAVRQQIWDLKFHVHKFGEKTHLTNGVIRTINKSTLAFVDDGFPIPARSAQLAIVGVPSPYVFSDKGDSGSVILDDSGRVVGLLWGHGDVPTGVVETWANHIADVTDALNVTIATNPPIGPWRIPESALPRFPEHLQRELDSVGSMRLLPKLYRKHVDEVDHLLRFNRLVGETFRFNHGPAGVHALGDLMCGRLDTVPEHLNGQPWATCVDRIVDAFLLKASPSLKGNLEALRPLLAAFGGRTYREILTQLSAFDTRPILQ